MEEHTARKEVVKKPRFRLATEVRATLERKYDRWSPVRAYNRVAKELMMLISLCKIILGFFKKTSEDAKDEDVLCDGRAVRMFSDMIRKSFKDEEFMSGKPVSSYIFFSYLWFCLLLVFLTDH